MAYLHYEDPSGKNIAIAFDATMREQHSSSSLITEHAVEDGANISDHMRPENDRLTLDIVVSNTPIRTKKFNDANPELSDMEGSVGSFVAANLFVSRPKRRLPGNPKLINPGTPKRSIKDLAPGATAAGVIAGNAGGPIAGIAVTGAVSVNVIPGTKAQWEAQPYKPSEDPEGLDVRVLQFSTPFDRVKAVHNALLKLKNERITFTVVTSLRTYQDMGMESLSINRSADIGDAFEGTMELRQVRIVNSETVEITTPLETRGEKKRKRGNQPTTEPDEAQTEKDQSILAGIFSG